MIVENNINKYKTPTTFVFNNIEFAWVPGYENIIACSKTGDVYSAERKVKNGKGFRTIKAKILNQTLMNTGYYEIYVGKKGTDNSIRLLVHRIVALTWIENTNPEINNIVDHIDRNKQNNNVENLRWTTQKENILNGQIWGTECGTGKQERIKGTEKYIKAQRRKLIWARKKRLERGCKIDEKKIAKTNEKYNIKDEEWRP